MNRQDLAVGQNESARDGVTVIVRRRIKPGSDKAFEEAMRQFIDFASAFPGHEQIHVIRPTGKPPHDYTVVDKFSDAKAREAFKASPQYRAWMDRLGELTEGDPTIEEMGGLAGWFTLPEQPTAKPPPKPKMAVVTFLGVFPLALLIPRLLLPLEGALPKIAVAALINACIVASLTWVVMPFLTKLFKPWLFPGRD